VEGNSWELFRRFSEKEFTFDATFDATQSPQSPEARWFEAEPPALGDFFAIFQQK